MDRLHIDGLIDGLAHARILEGVLALDVGVEQLVAERIHVQEDGAQLRPGEHRVLGLFLMRSMSCTGTGSIMSMSPESSAATRVASDLMVWNITSVRLCSTLPHQFGLGLNTVFTPGSWLTTVNGPVPLALRANGLSEVADADWACVAPFASDHVLEKMYQVSHSACRMGLGEASTKSTV